MFAQVKQEHCGKARALPYLKHFSFATELTKELTNARYMFKIRMLGEGNILDEDRYFKMHKMELVSYL